jgi:hypothetical protein
MNYCWQKVSNEGNKKD